jgi:hypothetical protein
MDHVQAEIEVLPKISPFHRIEHLEKRGIILGG